MKYVIDFIKIISAILTWGLFIFICREIFTLIINKCKKKYKEKSFKLIQNYINACIDALFFLLPYITWIENNHIITDISNNSFLIDALLFDIFVIFCLFPYSFINLGEYIYFVKIKKQGEKSIDRIIKNRKINKVIFKKDKNIKHYKIYYIINRIYFGLDSCIVILISLIYLFSWCLVSCLNSLIV